MDKKIYSNLIVSISASYSDQTLDTTRIMLMVLIALAPSFAMSIYVFGPRVIALTLVCLVSCMFFEWAYNKLMQKTSDSRRFKCCGNRRSDCIQRAVRSALLDCNSRLLCSYHHQLSSYYGGIGKNLVNPAITARIVLFITICNRNDNMACSFHMAADATSTGATPLGILAEGSAAELPSNMDMFMGYIGGSMGEVSAIALLIGGLFLIWRKDYKSYHSGMLYRNGICICAYILCCNRRRKRASDGSIPRTCRRRYARCLLYGDRLCYNADTSYGQSYIRHRLRCYHNADQAVRPVSWKEFPSQYC